MARMLFEKTGQAIWISHLDLMRLFQRAFKRAGLHLKHTQGFNPRPSVSIALPLSVGVESCCELLDFELDGQDVPPEQIRDGLNRALVAGVRVLRVYDDGRKLKELALLQCRVVLTYDAGVPVGAGEAISALFAQPSVIVDKRGKTGVTQQNIVPMIRRLQVEQREKQIWIEARICCQNPSLNPMQLCAAVERYLPELRPDFAQCCRLELFDTQENIFR